MKGDCDGCKQPLNTWDYRYHGSHYCRQCCDRLFKVKKCSICDKSKMIFIDLAVPVCKICQVKDKSCIRCGKTKYSHGQITSFGPVCNSCSKYFREYRTCSTCSKTSNSVSNRTLLDGQQKVLCKSCYNKTLPICYRCGKQRKAYDCDEDGHPICHICTIEHERICKQCGQAFPAGKGKICGECGYKNTFQRRVAFGSKALSLFTSDLFIQFGIWLKQRRGVLFAATHIHHYIAYFLRLDDLAQTLERIPIYAEVVGSLGVVETRANLLVTLFLDQTRIILVDKKIHDEYADIDMITRYIERFIDGTWASKAISKYTDYLHLKFEDNKITIRSIRLALGSVAKLLSYVEYLQEEIVTEKSLYGYLWKYPGQRNSITGFVNFLNREFHVFTVMPEKPLRLHSPKQGQIQLKQHLIDLLRECTDDKDHQRKLIRTAVAYLHGIDIPESIYIPDKDLNHTKSGDIYIRLAGYDFYLPKEVVII